MLRLSPVADAEEGPKAPSEEAKSQGREKYAVPEGKQTVTGI